MSLHPCLRSLALMLAASTGCMGEGLKTDSPKGGDARETLTQIVSPSHLDSQPWAFVPANAVGGGPCAATTVAELLDQIRDGFADVQDITNLKAPGPVGITVVAGPVAREGTSPPAVGTASYIIALQDERSLAAIFFRGAGCSGENCQDRRYWFFETGDGCRPRWVGYNRAVDRAGGNHGACVDFEGTSVWSTPGDPEPRRRCDADWSPQNISGTRRAASIDPFGCGQTDHPGPVQVVPIVLSITQEADLGLAALTLSITGIPFVDGRSFVGKVERQSFTSSTDETVAGDCPVRRRIDIGLDFEEPTNVGLPGGFGVVEITSDVPIGCSPTFGTSCRSSMHLVKEGIFPMP
jgi:hypothetical protein